MKIDEDKWSLEYIEELGTSNERPWFDFKKSPALSPDSKDWEKKKADISKDISAFSISGGYIIYGVDNNGKVDESGGVLTRLKGAKPTSDWIEQTFSPLVKPSLKVHVIPVPDERSERAVYVVAIPESPVGPHQALDKRYYGRFGSSSDPLADEWVRAIMFRQRYPVVRPRFSFETRKEQELTLLIMHVHFYNYGPIRARDFTLHLDYPSHFVSPEPFKRGPVHYESMPLKSRQTTSKILHPEEKLPITAFFELVNHAIPKFYIEPHEAYFGELPIRWKLWADDSPPSTGEFTLYELRRTQEIQF